MRVHLDRIGLAICAACLTAAALVPAVAGATPSFHTPGYRWNRKLPKVAPVIPGKLITLGDGEYPHVVVDAAGTGQIAYTTAPLVLRLCCTTACCCAVRRRVPPTPA